MADASAAELLFLPAGPLCDPRATCNMRMLRSAMPADRFSPRVLILSAFYRHPQPELESALAYADTLAGDAHEAAAAHAARAKQSAAADSLAAALATVSTA